MRNVSFAFAILVLIAFLPLTTQGQAATNQTVADDLMAMVKADWAALAATPPNVMEASKSMTDDYTEFNVRTATRVDGKAMSLRMMEPMTKSPNQRVVAEMLNPKVQVYGDAAILTYNFAGAVRNKDGEMKPMESKVTRVYVKQGGKWKLAHANFAAQNAEKD